MLKFITNMPISRRLLCAFLLAALIPGMIISILGFAFITEQKNRSQAGQINIHAFKKATIIGSYLPQMSNLLTMVYQEQYASLARPSSSVTDTMQQLQDITTRFTSDVRQYWQDYQINTALQMHSIYHTLLNNATNAPQAAQQASELAQIHSKLLPEYQQSQDQFLRAITAKMSADQVSARLQQTQASFTVLQQGWNRIIDNAEQTSYAVVQGGSLETNAILIATIVALLSTILIVSAIGYIVYLTITRPLHQLALLTRRIAQGETHARARINSRDEISLVANSINNMLDNIVNLIQDTQSQRDILQLQVEKLVSEVSGVGEGDLRIQAEVTTDALGVLADSFNYMVEELSSLVIRVKLVSSEVVNSTATILEHMTQLVDSGNTQLKQISRATVSVEEVTMVSQQVAERSQVLYEVAHVARQNAQIGRESVQQAIAGMGRINENVHTTAGKVLVLGERSREINEIVEAISGIAHQTNRLALDAAIQAAMAGENGKGFGAVAADIRRLAERSKVQAKLITHIVRSVREDIGAVAVSMQDTERETQAGTHLTQEAGIALESIFAAVEHQAHEIENINLMATQQLQSASAVVQLIQCISETTRESSHSGHEASQNMERLARLVEQLRTSVAAFKLRDNQGYIPNTSTLLALEDEADNPLTVSGVFRTINSSSLSQPLYLANLHSSESTTGVPLGANTPMPESSADIFPFYPMPSQQPGSSGIWSWRTHSPESAPGVEDQAARNDISRS